MRLMRLLEEPEELLQLLERLGLELVELELPKSNAVRLMKI
jgi:hypothetical protein